MERRMEGRGDYSPYQYRIPYEYQYPQQDNMHFRTHTVLSREKYGANKKKVN